MTMLTPEPETPAMRRSPVTRAGRAATGTCATEHLAGVGIVDADFGDRLDLAHQPGVDRERAHTRRDVAAVARIVDHAAVDLDLGERVVEVGVGRGRAADDGDLRREQIGAAQAVDLHHVRRAHDAHQQRIAFRACRGRSCSRKKTPLPTRPGRSSTGCRPARTAARNCSRLSPGPWPPAGAAWGGRAPRESVYSGTWPAPRDTPCTLPAAGLPRLAPSFTHSSATSSNTLFQRGFSAAGTANDFTPAAATFSFASRLAVASRHACAIVSRPADSRTFCTSAAVR